MSVRTNQYLSASLLIILFSIGAIGLYRTSLTATPEPSTATVVAQRLVPVVLVTVETVRPPDTSAAATSAVTIVSPTTVVPVTSTPVVTSTTTVVETTPTPVVSNTVVEAPQRITVQLKVQGPGIDQSYTVTVPRDATVHAVMKQASEKFGFGYSTKQFAGLGTFVDGIAGIKSNDDLGKYWIFYVNNRKATIGVTGYVVSAGDTIKWKYEQSYN